MATNIEAFQDTLAGRIDISKYSNYNKLLRVTARIMKPQIIAKKRDKRSHPT